MNALRLELTVSPADEGLPVKTLLRQRLELSTNLLRRLKQVPDGILLDGAHVTVRTKVRAGQVLSVLREPDTGRQSPVLPQTGRLDILYEDDDLLVVNKPAGMPVHPSPGHAQDTLANYVRGHYEAQGVRRLFHPINRLDRGTSGLLCIAKTQLCAQRLGAQLQRREIRRTYYALVAGSGLPDRGTIDLPIGRKPGAGIAREVRPDGERAVTHFSVLERRRHAMLLELQLETGRTHQIRVHCSHLGHPVLGDFMYGTEYPWLDGQALHACGLELAHPITGETLSLKAPPPWYFAALLEENPLLRPPIAEPCAAHREERA